MSENPLDRAVRLVEFVRRTAGAPHLKHHGRQASIEDSNQHVNLKDIFQLII